MKSLCPNSIAVLVALLIILAGPLTAGQVHAHASVWISLDVTVIQEFCVDMDHPFPYTWAGMYRKSGPITIRDPQAPFRPGTAAADDPLAIHDQQAYGYHTCQEGQRFPMGRNDFDLNITYIHHPGLDVRQTRDGRIALYCTMLCPNSTSRDRIACGVIASMERLDISPIPGNAWKNRCSWRSWSGNRWKTCRKATHPCRLFLSTKTAAPYLQSSRS